MRGKARFMAGRGERSAVLSIKNGECQSLDCMGSAAFQVRVLCCRRRDGERKTQRERERQTEKVKVKDHGHILNTTDSVQLSMSGDFSVQSST